WTAGLGAATVWDLYCGVGGFALHLAPGARHVTGIERSEQAIASAQRSAMEVGVSEKVSFAVADATEYATSQARCPDLVVVNPPRRGIGARLAGWLQSSQSAHLLYSSCNVASLAQDLARMPSLRPVRAQVLDMFPQTGHFETLVLLERA